MHMTNVAKELAKMWWFNEHRYNDDKCNILYSKDTYNTQKIKKKSVGGRGTRILIYNHKYKHYLLYCLHFTIDT